MLDLKGRYSSQVAKAASQVHLDRIKERFGRIEAKSALQPTPAIMSEEFAKRAVEVRAEDRMLLADTRRDLDRAIGEHEGQMRHVASYVPRALTSATNHAQMNTISMARSRGLISVT